MKPAAGDLVVRLCAAGGVAAVNTHHCYQEVVCVCGHRSRLPFGARQRPVSSRRHTSKQGRAQAAHGSDPVQPSTKASLGTPGSGGVNSDVPAAATAGQTGSDAVPTATPTPQMAAAKTPGEPDASSSKPLKPKATARKTPGAFCRAHAPLNVAAWHPTHHLCETPAAGQALAPSLQSPQPVGAERRTRRSGAWQAWCKTNWQARALALSRTHHLLQPLVRLRQAHHSSSKRHPQLLRRKRASLDWGATSTRCRDCCSSGRRHQPLQRPQL